MPTFSINNEEVIAHSAKLDRLHRSALPSAIRNTLTELAFNSKKKVTEVAKIKFGLQRSKTFIKAHTGATKARGFDVNTMQSSIGVYHPRNSKVVKGLSAQEKGGPIKSRKLIAHDDARISKTHGKRIASRNKFKNTDINRIHRPTAAFRAHRGTRKSKFVAAAFSAVKSGNDLLFLKTGRTGMIYKITGLTKNDRNRSVSFKAKKLYNIRDKNTSTVKKRKFIEGSALMAYKNVNRIYKAQAEFQIKKWINR